MATNLSNLDKFLKKDFSQPSSLRKKEVCISGVEEILLQAQKKGISLLPLDIRKVISEIFKIEIVEVDLGRDVSGFLERIGSNWKIYINVYESEVRKRFTLAHELGHFVCHRDKYTMSGTSEPDQIFFRDEETLSPIEQEANNFAANLLMPEQKFRDEVKNGTRKIIDLAEKFKLSTSAIKYRAYKLGMLSEYK